VAGGGFEVERAVLVHLGGDGRKNAGPVWCHRQVIVSGNGAECGITDSGMRPGEVKGRNFLKDFQGIKE
jgi:hypothetical protein